VLVRNESPPLLFIALRTGVEWLETPPRWNEGPTRRHHVEAHEGGHKVGSADLGSADPMWTPLKVCFLQVYVLWVLKLVLGVHLILRRFGCQWALQSM
jgi:hypothetical protein